MMLPAMRLRIVWLAGCILLAGTACPARPLRAPNGAHVFIVVVDGGRYTETFGARDRYMPVIWNLLRPQGAIYTRCYNTGMTKTCPGHSALLTGRWQPMPNDGTVRPSAPTLFEVLRKETGEPERSCYVVSGKKKLDILTHSTDHWYGKEYGALYVDGMESDTATWAALRHVMDADHPRVVIVNFPETDITAHDGSWDGYCAALHRADSLVGLLWTKIAADPVYGGTTTLFVTNDHGRHDDGHGGFRSHGDACDGCSHIMLLALGQGVPKNVVVDEPLLQVDVAPTAAGLLDLEMPLVTGRAFLPPEGSR